ncbi:hypothetical protein [Bradyrhizobium macuxiense]|uniref:hypothetical protein n=1 Tax=Bradyrhizobium macuxiense TaxID=1755647 RepID=UPI000B322A3B|nr:hypothetical protein [Bradyrhizobium macuxiense]
MDKPKADDTLESAYLRGYQRGAADAMKAHELPINVEIWDYATVRLADWLGANPPPLPYQKRQQ